jgi:uncharacterized membrane protein AbrB (regulator of aidB expression)
MSELTLMWMFGAIAALSFVAGLFFLRFAVVQRDRFFGWFAAAFWFLGLSWGIHLVTGGPSESHPFIYVLRAVAYVLIIVAIIDKNRKR